MSFWDSLPRPFFVLAPMYDVTDAAFRRLIAGVGKPDVMITEFVSADGLCSAEGGKRLSRELWYTPAERPIVAQLFGAHPDTMREAARLAASLGFDGVDLNFGCPDRAVMKQGSCAAVIGNRTLAHALIAAAQEGAVRTDGTTLPVSVKTRIGKGQIITEEWIGMLLEAHPAAISVHGRTAKEMSKVPAHWDEIAKAARLARAAGVPLVGNGDVRDLAHARELAATHDVDGVMLGRAIFGNPWLFAEHSPTVAEKLAMAVRHTELFWELFGPHTEHPKHFALMKKHFKAYVEGFAGAKELRAKLMEAENPAEVREIVETTFLADSPPR